MPYCPQCGQNHAQTGGAPAARGLSYTEQMRRAAVSPLGGLLTADVHAASMYAHTGAPMAFNAAALHAAATQHAAVPASAQSPQKMNLPTSFDATYRDASGTPALVAPNAVASIVIPAKGVVPAGFQVSDLVTDPSSYGFVVTSVKVGRDEVMQSECAFPARDGLAGSNNIGHSDPVADGQHQMFVQVRNILSTPAYYKAKIVGHY